MIPPEISLSAVWYFRRIIGVAAGVVADAEGTAGVWDGGGEAEEEGEGGGEGGGHVPCPFLLPPPLSLPVSVPSVATAAAAGTSGAVAVSACIDAAVVVPTVSFWAFSVAVAISVLLSFPIRCCFPIDFASVL